MDKDLFYNKLHKELAKEFKTTPDVINYIRNHVIGMKGTQQQMISHCLHKKRISPKPKWAERLNFLLNLNQETLNIIVSRSTLNESIR